MSDWFHHIQQQSQEFIGNPDSIQENNKNSTQHQAHTEQLSAKLNETVVTSSITNTNEEEKNCEQHRQETNVVIRLDDCMRCFVRIPRCQIEEQDHCSNTHTRTTLEQQIRKHSEEEEKRPQQQQQQQQDNQDQSQEEIEEEFFGVRLDFDSFNFMENLLSIDLPSPEFP